jgi:GNAT superfamily N-acetyltransferase
MKMNNLTLRKATSNDYEFAFHAKKSAFKKYVEKVWGWDEEKQRLLHERRFQAQDFRVINLAGKDVGIMAVVVASDSVTVNQLFLLPEYQDKGIGRQCMLVIMEEARKQKLSIHLSGLKVNPRALVFYERLGFTHTGETDTHNLMEWQS